MSAREQVIAKHRRIQQDRRRDRPKERTVKLKTFVRPALVAIALGTIHGRWAAYVNWNHGFGHAVRAASTQFVLSFCSTLFLTPMIERILARERSASNLVLAALGPQAGMVALFVTIHWLAGTPHVLKTIAPAASIGLVFSVLYVLKRGRPSIEAAVTPAAPGWAGEQVPTPRRRPTSSRG